MEKRASDELKRDEVYCHFITALQMNILILVCLLKIHTDEAK